MPETTHVVEAGVLVQIVSAARLREVLDAEGSDYTRPVDFGPDDEWELNAPCVCDCPACKGDRP